MNTKPNAGTAPDAATLDADFCSQLSRHLHDLKNLLWPVTVQAECGPSGTISPALAVILKNIGRDVQESLALATKMSELIDHYSQYVAVPEVKRVALGTRCAPAPLARGLRILCVDDDQNLAGAMARLLKHLGHDVDISASGSDALQAVASRPYDLVMTDTHLADMNGRDLTRSIRALGPIPVIWLTDRDLAVAGIPPDAPDFPSAILTKPLSLGALRKALDRLATPAAAVPATAPAA